MNSFVIATNHYGNTITLDINGELYLAIFGDDRKAKRVYSDFNNPNRNNGKILSNLRKDSTVEIERLLRSDDPFPKMPWEENIMRIEKEVKQVKEVKKESLIEVTEDIKIGNFIIEKGDKVKIIEKAKWNSGFTGYVITDISQSNIRRLEPILQDYDVSWDALIDMGWTQFITDVQDKDKWEELATEVALKTGLNISDSYKNQ